jgi:GNAT superfamily N-acetyltransferase
MVESISIKRLSADTDPSGSQWAAVRELCCRTANDGAAIAAERWPLFGEIWIEPYRQLLPDWTYVAVVEGRVVGYLTGCPDTATFARRQFVRCTMPLLPHIVFGRFRGDSYGKRFARQQLGLEKSVERRFPLPARRQIAAAFPAHLHMNVDADYRHGGVGTRLMMQYVDDLQRVQIPGVHLFCGGVPVPFYTRMGFCELAVTPVRGQNVHAMGLSLSSLRSHSLDVA